MEKDKKKIILISIGVILLITLVVGLSYAMYTFTGSGTKENVIQTGHIVITFNDVNNISIQNRYPETDSEGLANTDTNSQMTFTVTSDITGDTKVNYALGITDIQEGATLTQDYIKIYLKKGNDVATGFTENKGELISTFRPLYIENIMDSHVLLTDVISGSEVHTYTLKAWIDENYKLPTDDEGYCLGFSNEEECTAGNGTWTSDGCVLGLPEENCNEFNGKVVENGCLLTKEMCETGPGWITTKSTSISETFKFKIKGYGTTESIEVKETHTLNQLILGKNNSNVLNATATLTDTYSSAGDASGLYKSIDGETNSGTTYFYRGNNGCQGVVMTQDICTLLGGTTFTASDSSCRDKSYNLYFTNNLTQEQCLVNGGTYDENAIKNYINFANMLWRIVRINENGSIRLLLNDGINNNTNYSFNPTRNNYTYMYYSNSDVDNGIKRTVDTWYNDNLKTYEDYIADTEFCEQYKVSWGTSGYKAGNETVVAKENYTSNFKCSTDKNGKGIITSKVGLLTYDEAVHAGNYPDKLSASYITNSNFYYWLMSPAGVSISGITNAWRVNYDGSINEYDVGFSGYVSLHIVVRPVISLKAGLLATGSGTSDDPYVVEAH